MLNLLSIRTSLSAAAISTLLGATPAIAETYAVVINAENTFSGIVKELKPEIQGLIGIVTNKYGANPPAETQGQLNGVNTDSKFAIIIAMLNGLSDADFMHFWELIVRFGQTELPQRNTVLELLRSETADFNDQLNEYNSKPNK